MLYYLKRFLFIFLLLPLFLEAGQADSVLLQSYRNKIYTYRYTKHLDTAVFYFKKALPIAVRNKDSVALFYIHKTMGDAYEHHRYLDSTLALYNKCEKLIPEKNYKLKALLLNDKAYTYRLLYDFDKAALLSLESLKMAELSGDSREIANTSIGVAEGYTYMKMDEQSEFYYLRAIDVSEKAKDYGILAQARRYYGGYLLERNQLNAAKENLKKSEAISFSLKDSLSLAFTWDILAEYYWRIQKTDSCFLYAKMSEKIWQERVEYIDLSNICYKIGVYYFKLNQLDESEKYLKKAEKYATDDISFNEVLFAALADLYYKKGNSKLAFEYLHTSKELGERNKQDELAGKQQGLRIKFDADQKEILLKKEKEQSIALKEEADRKTGQRNKILYVLLFVFVTAAILIFAYIKIKRKNVELNKTNEALELSGEQKLLLLKEVHHRVKNNLTTLKSLFYLQARASSSEEVKAVLEECQLRIQSMALIHQSLYEENENEKVEFQHFLVQLFNELELSIKPAGKDVEIEYKCMDVQVEMSTALFLGMIVNELATNSFKYAFKERSSGRVGVELMSYMDRLELVYYDDGIGLPFDYDLEKGGFGMKLIRILTGQINAVITYEKRERLSVFTIKVPYAN